MIIDQHNPQITIYSQKINIQHPHIGQSSQKQDIYLQTPINQLYQSINKISFQTIQSSFKQIKNHSNIKKNKQLLYAAVYGNKDKIVKIKVSQSKAQNFQTLNQQLFLGPNNQKSQAQQKKRNYQKNRIKLKQFYCAKDSIKQKFDEVKTPYLKRIRQGHTVQILTKQTEEFFQINDDISTIFNKSQYCQKQSMIEIQNLFQLNRKKIYPVKVQKIKNIKQKNIKNQLCGTKRSSSRKNESQNLTTCEKIIFKQQFKDKGNQYNNSAINDQTVRILNKKNIKSLQNKHKSAQKQDQVYIIRQTRIKQKRNQGKIKQKSNQINVKYIKIPLSSNNVKIIDIKKQYKNNSHKRSYSTGIAKIQSMDITKFENYQSNQMKRGPKFQQDRKQKSIENAPWRNKEGEIEQRRPKYEQLQSVYDQSKTQGCRYCLSARKSTQMIRSYSSINCQLLSEKIGSKFN